MASSSPNPSHYQIAVSEKRLADILENKTRYDTLGQLSDSYNALSKGNQKALAHLVRAAHILDAVFLQQDHPENINIRNAFILAADGGSERAKRALKLWQQFNGFEGLDLYGKKARPLRLVKGKKIAPGQGFYPQNMTKAKLKKYILANPEQAGAILSNNTMVRENDGQLEAIPYSVAFREEMMAAAKELYAAAAETDHEGLANYLRLQAQALVNDTDADIVYRAEKAWIELEDTPLEFTIGRENYADLLSAEVAADSQIKKLLDENGIIAKPKDTLGVRVGIVNPESASVIENFYNELESFGQTFPHFERYASESDKQQQMTFADVDLVAIEGEYKASRGGLTVAQILPNDDKLSATLELGSRMVFHRQMRTDTDPEKTQRYLDMFLNDDQRHLYNLSRDFEFTIAHEMSHSKGPQKTDSGGNIDAVLGQWGPVIEENKADIASIAMAEHMYEAGRISRQVRDEIYVTWVANELPSYQPSEKEAHRFRSIMQLNYFRENGAITFEKGGQLEVHVDLLADVARQMLDEVIDIQLNGDLAAAEEFCKSYGQWNEALEYSVEGQAKLEPKRYRDVAQPLRNRLLHAEF